MTGQHQMLCDNEVIDLVMNSSAADNTGDVSLLDLDGDDEEIHHVKVTSYMITMMSSFI